MVNSFLPAKIDDSLLQRIAHRVDGDILTFQAPVEVLDNGDKVVMLQPILDVFPDTAALCRKNRQIIPFLTNKDDVLLVPVRVEYGDEETYFVVPSSGPPPPPPQPTPSRPPEQSCTPSDRHQAYSTEAAVLTIAQETTTVDLPVPQLFVVLPDPRPRDWNDSAFSSAAEPRPIRPYRLYFLCDCGPGFTFPYTRPRPRSYHSTLSSHTRSTRDLNNSNVNNNDTADFDNCIHIADQSGYDIGNLKQFSDQFGEYTLMLLRAFQQGIDTTTSRGTARQSRILLPPLSQRLYPDVLQPFTWDIEERVSTAIATFDSMSSQHRNLDSKDTNDIEVLPTIDLHRLWECVEGLKQAQENKVQSMRRMFVNDGTARWLCEAHYQSTFGYVQDDRDMFLWRCQEILGDDGDLLLELSDSTPAANAKSNENGLGGDDSRTTPQAVAFDYQKMHLRLTGSLDLRQIAQLKVALKSAYMLQQVSLTMTLPNSLVLMAIADLISDSSITMWNVSFVVQEDDTTIAQRTLDSKAPSSVPPPYTPHEPSLPAQTSSAADSSSDSTSSSNNHNTTLHALHTLFVLGNIKSLRIPDLDAHLYKALAPSPGEFPHLRQFHVWGSNPLGQPNLPGVGAWGAIRPGALLKAFCNLTELRMSGVYLGTRKRRPQSDSMPQDGVPTAPLYEFVESLVYLPHLSVLELSACGLLKQNCGLLSRSIAVIENRMTHLDIHNNWIEDAGLAELLWIVGPRLISLDARNCGFGNESAFALASTLQAHAHEVNQDLRREVPSQMAIFRVLKLEETEQPHLRLYYDTLFYAFETDVSAPSMSRVANQLSVQGRQHLVQALELLQPMELCLSFELGFQDSDFASAFAGMKNLESLERLQVAYSNFGPLALAAMLRTLRATSCRIREISLQSTLLTVEQQQDAVQQILSI
ncbi:hypothetical protein BGW39_009671 [Mortierella sp. 14UC]|nr:hypothetical protein BGW39_009671 [Mortierella sp. 14UC]